MRSPFRSLGLRFCPWRGTLGVHSTIHSFQDAIQYVPHTLRIGSGNQYLESFFFSFFLRVVV